MWLLSFLAYCHRKECLLQSAIQMPTERIMRNRIRMSLCSPWNDSFLNWRKKHGASMTLSNVCVSVCTCCIVVTVCTCQYSRLIHLYVCECVVSEWSPAAAPVEVIQSPSPAVCCHKLYQRPPLSFTLSVAHAHHASLTSTYSAV